MKAAAAACLLAFIILASAPALAQTSAAPEDARALFERGRSFSSEERWLDALDAFQRSLALAPRANTLFNIAAVLVRLGRAQEALGVLSQLESLGDPRRDAALLTQGRELRASAETSLRHVILRIAPAGARVEVDGAVVEGTGSERRATLDPGAHSVRVSLDGHREERFQLAVGEETRDVALAPLDATLIVTSTIDTASIAIDGTVRGVGHVESTVAPGGHLVALEAEGYLPFERRVDVGPGARLDVDAALELVPRGENLLESPLFWGLSAAGVAVVAAVIIGAVVATAGTEPAYAGTSGVILAPLGTF